MSDIHKSRNRIGGRRYSAAEYPGAMENAILQRINAGITSPQTIGEQLGKDRSVISKFTKILAAKGRIILTESGRIEKNTALVQQAEYAELDADNFVQRYPSIKHWVDDMQVRKEGKPIVQWKQHLLNIKKVCDVLKITPEYLINSKENVQDYIKAFILEYRKLSDSNTHMFIMSIRNYAMDAGIVWPRGISGVMSGKKVSFGKYAHIKLTEQQKNQLLDHLFNIGGPEAVAWGAIGIETAARHEALEALDINSLEDHGDYKTIKAWESKTSRMWIKYIVDPIAQEIFAQAIDNAKIAGRTQLFLPGAGYRMNKILKEAYKSIGLTDPYFFAHPTHALRHIGAHHWLRLTNYNYALVAKIGGWDDVNTLIKCYGEMPAEVIIAEIGKARKLMA